MPPLLLLAAKAAQIEADRLRRACLGAIGVRVDGAIVSSRNQSSRFVAPQVHAEARLARKLDRGATVYLARIRRDGSFAMSKPCSRCMATLRARNVAKVVYSISDHEWASVIP